MKAATTSAHARSAVVEADMIGSLTALFHEASDSVFPYDAVHSRALETALLNPAREILSRSGKGFRARTLERSWQLAGGCPDGPPELLPVVIELLHVGSLIIDDIEDDSRSRRGKPALHRQYGLPLALNTGNWLYFAALAALSRTPLPAEVRLALYEDISVTLMNCHQGQALDLSVQVTESRKSDLAGLVASSTRLKTGSLMQLASTLGARAAGASASTVTVLGSFGVELGVGLQMLDDWSGIATPLRREKGREDIKLSRLTWPWAWLAETTDELTYIQTVHQARAVSMDWDADQVLDRLGTLLSPIAPAKIRTQLDHALRGLEDGLGGHLDLTTIREDLDKLEKAFG